MKQVTFSRVRPAGGRWSVCGRACTCRPAIGASPGCHKQRGAAGDPSWQPALGAELSPVRHHRRLGLSRLADSTACDDIPPSDTYRLDCHHLVLLLPTPLRRAVTLALRRCNAKKNLSRTRSLESSIVRNSACNVCQGRSIFSENASVSYAVDSSIDRMMLSRNRTTDFPYWPTFVGVLARVPSRNQRAPLPRAEHMGAL